MATVPGQGVKIQVKLVSTQEMGSSGTTGGGRPKRPQSARTSDSMEERKQLQAWDRMVREALARREKFSKQLMAGGTSAAGLTDRNIQSLINRLGPSGIGSLVNTANFFKNNFKKFTTVMREALDPIKMSPPTTAAGVAAAAYAVAKGLPFAVGALGPGTPGSEAGLSPVQEFAMQLRDRIDFLENRVKAIGGAFEESVSVTKASSKLGIPGGAIYHDGIRDILEHQGRLQDKVETFGSLSLSRNIIDQIKNSFSK